MRQLKKRLDKPARAWYYDWVVEDKKREKKKEVRKTKKKGGEKTMGFSVQTGNVTVDLENRSTPKAAISYRKFDVDTDTQFTDLIETLEKEGVKEEVTVELTDDGEKSVRSGTTSLTQLLADGFNRYSYTQAVSKAKESFNSSPEKTDSNMSRLLQAVIDNPETAPDRKRKAQAMLSVLAG